jgi:hypothetical protein
MVVATPPASQSPETETPLTPSCTYHCRYCDGHFTSLKAFDAHKPRFASKGGCEWPADAPLRELTGICKIGDPDLSLTAAPLYEHESAAVARDYFALKGAQALSSQLMRDASAA